MCPARLTAPTVAAKSLGTRAKAFLKCAAAMQGSLKARKAEDATLG